MSNSSNYISFYAKQGQGFLFPQEIMWLKDSSTAKRPTIKEYESIKNTKQMFIGATENENGDFLGWSKLLVSDLEAVEVKDEYSVIFPPI